jgi:hypothetical protein
MFKYSDCLKQVSLDIYVNLTVTTPGRLLVADVSEEFDASDCRVFSVFIKGAEKTPKSGVHSLCPPAEQTLD